MTTTNGYGSKLEINPEFAKEWLDKQDQNEPTIKMGIFIGATISKAMKENDSTNK